MHLHLHGKLQAQHLASQAVCQEVLENNGPVGEGYVLLLDGRMKSLQRSGQSHDILSSALENHVALRLRFRHNSTTVILHPLEEIGVLDNKTAAALISLKDIAPAITFELFLDREEDQDSSGRQGKKAASIHPLQIQIYGPDEYYNNVGSALSNAGMYLQEPGFLDHGTGYRNPHFLSWDNNPETPLLNRARNDPKADFTAKIEAIMESFNPALQASPVKQDARIFTILRNHQLSALEFMLTREDEHQNTLSLWKPYNVNNKNGFVHTITQEKRSIKPGECRGGILADEMGMGKSLTLIALMMHTLDVARSSGKGRKQGSVQVERGEAAPAPTLIIAPKSTLYSWELEIERHTSSHLEVYVYHGQRTTIDHGSLANYDVVLTSYETVLSDANRSRNLQATFWFRIVLDEAHHIRNRTNAFQAIINLQTERRWCLTGTPVHNDLNDLFTLTEFLRFHPVENRQNARRWVLDPLETKEDYAIENLRLLVGTVALRRSRNSEMKHVRSDVEVAVTLSHTERQQYDSIRTRARNIVASVEKTTPAHNLLSCILQMRQVCSHGLHERGSRPEPADARVPVSSNTVCSKCLELLPGDLIHNSSLAESGESRYCPECAAEESSTLCLNTGSFSLQSRVCWDTSTPKSWTGVGVADVPGDDDGGDIDLNASTVSRPGWSSKIDSVVNNLVQLEQRRHPDAKPIKSLVFSFWTRTLDSLACALSSRNMASARIDGSLGLDQRRRAIERFQSESDLRIMLLSFGSGSVGLNLTAATHVHLVEPQWNPMVEAQAAARVDRLDQDKDVVILRYIVKDSIEGSVKARQRRKLWLAKLSTPYATTAIEANTVDSLEDLQSLIE